MFQCLYVQCHPRTYADRWFSIDSIPSNLVRSGDMVYLPIVFLSGFIVLANFLQKFAKWIIRVRDKMIPSLSDILETEREKATTAEAGTYYAGSDDKGQTANKSEINRNGTKTKEGA